MKKNGSNKHNNKQKTTTNDKNENKKQPTTTKHANKHQSETVLEHSTTISTKYRFKKKTSTINPVSARGSTLFGALTSAWKPKALPSMPGFKDPLTLNVSS